MHYGNRRLSKIIAAAVIVLSAFAYSLYLELARPPEKTVHPPAPLSSLLSSGGSTTLDRYVHVEYVIDGDTIILKGGERVRYLGINAPERGESGYREARERNASMVSGRSVRVVVCVEEPRDRYGRTLAWVYSDGVALSDELISEGLARPLIISPCARPRARELRALEKEARRQRRGIWGGSKGGAEPKTPG